MPCHEIWPEGEWTDVHYNADRTAWCVLSRDGLHRYSLGRLLDPANPKVCVFVMLNPSKADHLKDDATVRRCRGFARAWGYGAFLIVNLYAYRATQPADLWAQEDHVRVGRANASYLHAAGAGALIVCAWGANMEKAHGRWQDFVYWAKQLHLPLHCLGTTKDGHPKHPLRLPKALVPVPFLP